MANPLEVVITDPDGTKHYYNMDEAMQMGFTAEELTTGTARRALKNEQTGYSPTRLSGDFEASVSLDKDTGKITVKAPSIAIQNESFRENLSSQLKQLSAIYKKNPDYKFATTDENGDNVEKSVEDIINDLNGSLKNEDDSYNTNSIQYMALAASGLESQKDAYEKATGLDFDDEDIIKMRTEAIGPDVKDNTLQLISNLPEAWWLRNIDTYDPETGTAQYGDIMMNAYNKEKVSSEDMIKLWAALENYFSKGDFSDKEEYIRNVATARFLSATQPNMSWIRDVTENVKGFLDGIFGFATNLGTAGVVAVERIGDFFLFGGNWDERDDYYYMYGFDSSNLQRGNYRGGDPFSHDQLLDPGPYWDKIGKLVFDENGVPTYEFEHIGGTFENPSTVGELLRAEFKKNQATYRKDIEYLHVSQNGWDAVGYLLTELAVLIDAGNVLSDTFTVGTGYLVTKATAGMADAATTVADTAASLYASGSALGYGTTAAETARIVSGIKTIYDIAAATSNAGKFLNFIGQAVASAKTTEFIIGVVGESVAEAITGDPDRLVEVLSNREVSADTKTYLMLTYIGNAIGWGIGMSVGKFLAKAGDTTRGRAISANLSKKIFKIQNGVGDAFDRLILTVRRVKGDTLADQIESLYEKGGKYAKKQANAMAANMKLRDMRAAIINSDSIKIAGKSTDEINDALKEVEGKILELQQAEVALTSMQRQGMDIVQGWLKDDGRGIKEAAENFYEKAADVARAEKNAGDLFKPTKGAVSDMTKTNKTLRLFSQTTTNYVKASEKIDFINAYIRKYEHAEFITPEILNKIKAYRSELPELQAMVKQFLDNASPELRLAANNFIDADRKWWSKFEDLRSDLKLTDPDELAWYRGSNLWGTNGELYARTTRKQDLSEYVIKHRDGASNVKTFDNYEQYMAGASGDFSDPMAEMQVALYDAGNKQAYRSFKKSYNALTGSLTTKVSGDEVALYQKMQKGLKTNYFDSSENFIKGMVQDVDVQGGIDDVIKNLKLKGEQYKELKKTKAAMDTTAKKLQQKLDAVTAENAAQFIPYLDAEDTTELWDQFYDVSVRELLADGSEFVPNETKSFIFSQARELGLADLEPEKIKIETGTSTRISIMATEDDYPGWAIPEHPVWALDESSNNFDGMTRRDYYRKVKGKEFRVIEMPSNEYNQVMMDDNIGRMLSKKEMETVNSYVEKFKNGERADIPYIEYDKNGKIIGQEGRHRTMAAYKAGIEKTPVAIEYPVDVELPENLRQYRDVTDNFVLREQGYDATGGSITRTKSKLLSAYDNVNEALSGTADTQDMTFENRVKRSILKRNENVLNDTNVQKYLTELRAAGYRDSLETFLAERTFAYSQLAEEYDITVESLNMASRNVVEGYVSDMTQKGTPQRAAIDELCKFYGMEGDPNAIRYYALSAFMDNKSKYNRNLYEQIRKVVRKDHPNFGDARNDKIAHTLANGITNGIEEEFNNAYLVVKEMNPEAVHEQTEKIFDEVKEIADKIEEAESNRYTGAKNIIAMRNMQGKVEYYEADPLLARLMNFQYLPEKMNGFTQAIYNANYLWTKLFRLGTTSINLKSIINQSFRDPINMFIGGGAYRTAQQCMDDIVDVAGDDVVAWVKTYEPEAFGRLQRRAEETGEDLRKLVVEREFNIGKAISPTATETSMYRSLNTAKRARLNGVLDAYDDTLGDKTVRAIDKFNEKAGWANEWRETTLRNLSYQNGFAKAIKRGYSLDQARSYATFIMNEATTNFTRMTNHLASIRDTVPYFGAAINGSKSFFRLLSMDPVGVVGRLVGGLIIPSTALVAYSLMDENNRKIYQNIPEYKKEDAIVFVVGGQIVSIPVPQELGAFIAPFRQMVESMYGVTTNTFAQFAWHDILGFSPVDLTGFADLDFAKLEQSSPGFLDRIGRGISKLWAQLAPPALKSGLEIVTGVDPYTGKEIDKSYLDYDEDGNPIIKDYQAGELSKGLNTIFRSWGLSSSAPVIQNILSNIFGQGSVDIADFLTSLITQVPNGGWAFSATERELAMGEGYNPFYVLGERLTDPITIDAYDEAQNAWKTEVTKLYAMKEEILRSDEWKEYLEAKRTTDDPEKLKNINASKKNIVSDYFDTVKTVVNNLQANYGAEFTAAKFATVLSLMTMEEQTLDAGSYGSYLDKESYKTARSQAIQTMINMGFPSISSQDVLGKFTTDKEGNIFVRTYSPLAILQLDDVSGSSVYSQSNNQHYAVIRNLLADAGAYALREKYYDDVDKAYDAKDYDKVEKIMNEYNEKIIRVINPYIQQYTPESVLQGDVMDYLEDYIMVPSVFMGKGKYYSSSTGLNKQQGYARNYIKAIFNYGENKLNGNQ